MGRENAAVYDRTRFSNLTRGNKAVIGVNNNDTGADAEGLEVVGLDAEGLEVVGLQAEGLEAGRLEELNWEALGERQDEIRATTFPKTAIIVPYFGKFPSYFGLWLRSCAINPEIDWLLVTDISSEYEFPANVRVVSWDFASVVHRIQEVLGKDVVVPVPHKLCDYKVFYGLIFNELLVDYRYWGYCDVDVIFGKLASFITGDVLQSHDKLFGLGHFCLMPNTERVLGVIRGAADIEAVRANVLQNPRTTLFDEWYGTVNINTLFEDQGLRIYEDPGVIADLYSSSPNFNRSFWDKTKQGGRVELENNLLVWNEISGLTRFWVNGELVQREPVMYVHLKERIMPISEDLLGDNSDSVMEFQSVPSFGIFPSGFQRWDANRVPRLQDFRDYSEGFWKYAKRRGKRKWRNGLYLLKMRLGIQP